MKLLDELFRQFWRARPVDRWSRPVALATFVSAFAAALAAGFSAWSALVSTGSLAETRSVRNPVLVLVPKNEETTSTFRPDEGFSSLDVSSDGGKDRGVRPVFHITNYGSGPAVNVMIKYKWLGSESQISIPEELGAERVRGLPRIAMSGGAIDVALENDQALAVSMPIAVQAEELVGSIGPSSSRDVQLPPAVAYVLFPFLLNDAVEADHRVTSYLARGILPPTSPVAYHDLEITVSSDAVTSQNFSQTFTIRFAVVSAIDRKAKIDGTEYGRQPLPRIEAVNKISLVRTTFPRRIG